MPDPLTNGEIDDVLSSIRRLVSDHPESTDNPPRDRLMLTPALRVHDRVAPGKGPKTQPLRETSPVQDVATPETDAQTLEQRITELEQAIAASAGEWEPDGTEEGAGTLPPDMPPVFSHATHRDPAWTSLADSTPPKPRPVASTPDDEMSDSRGADNWAADDTARATQPTGTAHGARHTSPRSADEPGAEPDAPDAPPPAEPVNVLDDDMEEAVLDEEMLRDMVAEMVREELQGALGERITRNVRKLVRAEIQRALAARDLG